MQTSRFTSVYPRLLKVAVTRLMCCAVMAAATVAANTPETRVEALALRLGDSGFTVGEGNDTSPSAQNPIDDTPFFVRQHYLDFLNREPDAAGFQFWINNIESCGADARCREVKRIDTSAAFFLSGEFQRTGYFVHRLYVASFGRFPRLDEFFPDARAIGDGVVFGEPGAEERLEANKRSFLDLLVQRPEFVARYGSLTDNQYVLMLLTNARLGTSGELHIFRLDGARVVPPVNTPATGVGILRRGLGLEMSVNTALISLSFRNLTSPQTAAHLHGLASASANAPVLFDLPLGQFRDFRVTLSAQQLAGLSNGQLYLDVHTQNNPDGEIRGQIPQPLFKSTVLGDALANGLATRAEVLRLVVEDESFRSSEFNRAFVLMEYFGYLRRNPDDAPDNDLAGYNFWLQKLNQFGGDFRRAEMVKSFIASREYRARFGPP